MTTTEPEPETAAKPAPSDAPKSSKSGFAFGLVGTITGSLSLLVAFFGFALQYNAGTQRQAQFETDRRGCIQALYDFGEVSAIALGPYAEVQPKLESQFRPTLIACLETRALDSDSDFVQSWLDLYSVITEEPGSLFGSKDARAEAASLLYSHTLAMISYLRDVDEPPALQLAPYKPGAPDADELGLDYSGVCDALAESVGAWSDTQTVGIVPVTITRYDRLCPT